MFNTFIITHIVSIGATRSSDAMRTPISARRVVRMRAKVGSPFRPVRLKMFKNHSRLSLAMAYMSLGAPVRAWSPAPVVEKRAPIRIIHLVGHASRETVSPAASPNWSRRRKPRVVAPKNNTHVRSERKTSQGTEILSERNYEKSFTPTNIKFLVWSEDTNDAGGENSRYGANRDRLLSISQVTRPVGTSHDT